MRAAGDKSVRGSEARPDWRRFKKENMWARTRKNERREKAESRRRSREKEWQEWSGSKTAWWVTGSKSNTVRVVWCQKSLSHPQNEDDKEEDREDWKKRRRGRITSCTNNDGREWRNTITDKSFRLTQYLQVWLHVKRLRRMKHNGKKADMIQKKIRRITMGRSNGRKQDPSLRQCTGSSLLACWVCDDDDGGAAVRSSPPLSVNSESDTRSCISLDRKVRKSQ